MVQSVEVPKWHAELGAMRKQPVPCSDLRNEAVYNPSQFERSSQRLIEVNKG